MASKKENKNVCPSCGAKLGFMNMLADQYLECKKCKTALEFKYTNMIEKEKIDKFQKFFIPGLAVLLAVSVISLVMSFTGSVNNFLVIAQYVVLALLIVYIVFLVQMKKNLINLKQLKVVVQGSKAARK